MHIFVAFLVLAALIGGMALYKHKAKIKDNAEKLKAAAIAEAEQIKNEIASKL